MMKLLGIGTVALWLVALAALDDITTGADPSMAAEWATTVAAALWTALYLVWLGRGRVRS